MNWNLRLGGDGQYSIAVLLNSYCSRWFGGPCHLRHFSQNSMLLNTAGCSAKRSEIWDLRIPVKCRGGTFYCSGALVSKWPITQKQLLVGQNGLYLGLKVTSRSYWEYIWTYNVDGHFREFPCTLPQIAHNSKMPGRREKHWISGLCGGTRTYMGVPV